MITRLAQCLTRVLILCVCVGLFPHPVRGEYAVGLCGEPQAEYCGNAFDRVVSLLDTNGNGVSDTDDLIAGAREEVARAPGYVSRYHRGGFPPDDEGVCTDLVWRAFRYAGYDLKRLVDADIRAEPAAYPRARKPDANIDFRRVPNQRAFFARHGLTLSTAIIPGDADNLSAWQPGDIVTFTNPDHIAILSDRRNAEGIPFLLHNDGPVASEEDAFMRWYERGITGHYRFPPQ